MSENPSEGKSKSDETSYPIDPQIERVIRVNFKYHSPNPDQIRRYADIRTMAAGLATMIGTHCPASRERSLAVTALEESVMWANASIARNESDMGKAN